MVGHGGRDEESCDFDEPCARGAGLRRRLEWRRHARFRQAQVDGEHGDDDGDGQRRRPRPRRHVDVARGLLGPCRGARPRRNSDADTHRNCDDDTVERQNGKRERKTGTGKTAGKRGKKWAPRAGAEIFLLCASEMIRACSHGPLSPFQRSYAFVLAHGLDAVNADSQSIEHLRENFTAAATSQKYFA